MNAGASILVVEDAGIIAEAMKSELEEKGYRVFTAQDAQAASVLLDDPTNRFDLLITDLNLGSGSNGWAVASKARDIDAAMPILYLTGAPIDAWLIEAPKSLIMQKPVTAEGIAKAVGTFADRLAKNDKSCLSPSVESLQFKVSQLEEANRQLVKAAESAAR